MREKAALERHDRLHRLFVEDRLSFERERKRAIRELIESAEDEELRARLWEVQQSWDNRMRHAGSRTNRFILAQTFFWEHFHEVWHPAMKHFSALLNEKID
ncbi:MAG: DUF3135 domain-containing protein [Deltaproteobacteria bacterium]|nr:DUF3135 domain-containing protein [Deltaproteobacteria bacterium]